MGNYYIKLHHEILRDPKMGQLRDRLWRRAVECFLAAGEYEQDGMLPPADDMAWILRVDAKLLLEDLEILAKLNITELRDGRWWVKNFAKRQAPISDAERKRASRARHEPVTTMSRDGHENVPYREVEGEVEVDKEVEGEGGAAAPTRTKPMALSGILKQISNLTPPAEIMEDLQAALGRSPDEGKLRACLKEWVRRGYKKGNWAWALEWYKNGIPGGNGNSQHSGQKKSAQQILAEHRSKREGKHGN